ncbi:MAG: IS701 family transposase [Nitrospiraceae bacterium]|nr:IS701 family transposase [Nitrospiraceae bacterium]
MEGAFRQYVEEIGGAIGHADRKAPLREYMTGLLLPLERKSVEPMAAAIEPRRTGTAHQRMHHFVAKSAWSDEYLMKAVRKWAIPRLTAKDMVKAWIIDDTGFPKKGKHSVGVARQYCGQLGKQDNCQVAVSLSIATGRASLPIGYRLYLPKEWAEDTEKRAQAEIPDSIEFQTKPEIAIELVKKALDEDIPRAIVLADAGYGNDTDFREKLNKLKVVYAVGIQKNTNVWAGASAPLQPLAYQGKGRPRKLLIRDKNHSPVSVADLAASLPRKAWKNITWREGVAGEMTSRFARLRVRASHRDQWRSELRQEEWLVIEWPSGEAEPIKYWLSTMKPEIGFIEMILTIKMRWMIERDYQELKQEIGLGHFEGRGWNGFHHHASLCIAAYAFLVCARFSFFPSGDAKIFFKAPAVPKGFKPRGSASQRAACPMVPGDNTPPPHRRPFGTLIPLPLLPQGIQKIGG